MEKITTKNSIEDKTSNLQDDESSPVIEGGRKGGVHPIAKAFFDALDNNNNNNTNTTSSTTTTTTSSSSSSSTKIRQSESLKHKTQVLGWRNRHCQDGFYPLSVVTTTSTTKSTTTTTKFTVRQVQRGEIEGTYGTGATVWPAAVVLIKYLEKHQHTLIENKFVVDLGSGTGITSIAAAILGASRVICTDGEPNVVLLATDNINHYDDNNNSTLQMEKDIEDTDQQQQNGTNNPTNSESTQNDCVGTAADVIKINNCPINAQKYWWGDGSLNDTITKTNGGDGGSGCDVILVADCVLPKLYPIGPLVDAIDELIMSSLNENAVAILSYEHRYYPEYDPRIKFHELATSKGLQVTTIQQDQFDPIYCTDDIEIWHVTRKKEMTS